MNIQRSFLALGIILLIAVAAIACGEDDTPASNSDAAGSRGLDQPVNSRLSDTSVIAVVKSELTHRTVSRADNSANCLDMVSRRDQFWSVEFEAPNSYVVSIDVRDMSWKYHADTGALLALTRLCR